MGRASKFAPATGSRGHPGGVGREANLRQSVKARCAAGALPNCRLLDGSPASCEAGRDAFVIL